MLLATSSTRIRTLISWFKWHPMTWRASSAWPDYEEFIAATLSMTKLTNQDNIARAFKVGTSELSSHLAARGLFFTKIMLEKVLDSWSA